ncbi:DUF4189 domain-containing protein [Dyella sp.]|uniref:DUF4189 domain-containing protein n=1 Tax=Dyella sp. TaxID=1869338 RepID=UPI002D78F60E|nr:DUF4189 domain-containing protein [Dyella sp.]HET6432650.1 DUF4189 domain-containing protein [Dyella sp.]
MKRIFRYRLSVISMHPSGQSRRHILLAGFLFFTGLWAHPAVAQYACSGNQPGQRVVGMSQGGNGVAPVPLCVDDPSTLPQYQAPAYEAPPGPQMVWMDNYMTMAWHADASDGWIATGFGSFQAAEAAAVGACAQAMGDGCTVGTGVRNGGLALVRDEDGALWENVGDSVAAAKRVTLKSCREGGGKHCGIIRTAFAHPWLEAVGGLSLGQPIILAPEGDFRRKYGSVAWIDSKAIGGPWGSTVWVSTGRHKAEDASSAAVNACEKASGQQCVAARTVSGGAITIATDTTRALHVGSSAVYKTAAKDAESRCKEAKVECTVTATYDVQQVGDWTHDSNAALKAAVSK